MSASAESELRRIASYLDRTLASGAERIELLGFTLYFWRGTDPFYRDTALPRPGLRLGGIELAEVVAAFAARGRPSRIELIEELHPGLAPALADATGWAARRMPAMVMSDPPMGPVGGELLGLGTSESELATILRHLDEAMGGPGRIAPDEPANLRRDLALGRTAMMVERMGAVLAGSASLVRAGDTAELLAVWTDGAWRRQGVAQRLCRGLLQPWLREPGRLAWLAAESEAALRLYTGLGFRRAGTHTSFTATH